MGKRKIEQRIYSFLKTFGKYEELTKNLSLQDTLDAEDSLEVYCVYLAIKDLKKFNDIYLKKSLLPIKEENEKEYIEFSMGININNYWNSLIPSKSAIVYNIRRLTRMHLDEGNMPPLFYLDEDCEEVSERVWDVFDKAITYCFDIEEVFNIFKEYEIDYILSMYLIGESYIPDLSIEHKHENEFSEIIDAGIILYQLEKYGIIKTPKELTLFKDVG